MVRHVGGSLEVNKLAVLQKLPVLFLFLQL